MRRRCIAYIILLNMLCCHAFDPIERSSTSSDARIAIDSPDKKRSLWDKCPLLIANSPLMFVVLAGFAIKTGYDWLTTEEKKKDQKKSHEQSPVEHDDGSAQRLSAYEPNRHALQEKELRRMLYKERSALQTICKDYNEWQEEHTEYVSDPVYRRVQERVVALEQSLSRTRYEFHAYHLSGQARRLLEHELPGSVYHFEEGFGHQLNHVIHIECVNLVEDTAHYKELLAEQELVSTVVQCTHSALMHNRNGECLRALTMLNICWGFMSATIGIAEGAVLGVERAVTVVLHPVDTICCCAEGVWQLSILCANILEYITDAPSPFGKSPASQAEYDRLCAVAHTVYEELSRKSAALSVRGIARETTAFIAENAALACGIKALQGFFGTSIKKLQELKTLVDGEQELQAALAGGTNVPISLLQEIKGSQGVVKHIRDIVTYYCTIDHEKLF